MSAPVRFPLMRISRSFALDTVDRSYAIETITVEPDDSILDDIARANKTLHMEGFAPDGVLLGWGTYRQLRATAASRCLTLDGDGSAESVMGMRIMVDMSREQWVQALPDPSATFSRPACPSAITRTEDGTCP